MRRTREQWQKACPREIGIFYRSAFDAITDAKADIEELHDENARLRAQVAALVEAGQDALDIVWAENAVAKREGNTQYEGVTKRVYDKLKAALAAAESEATKKKPKIYTEGGGARLTKLSYTDLNAAIDSLKVTRDGNCLCVTRSDFENLQESPAVFFPETSIEGKILAQWLAAPSPARHLPLISIFPLLNDLGIVYEERIKSE